MDKKFLVGLVALIIALVCGGFFLLYFLRTRKEVDLRNMMSSYGATPTGKRPRPKPGEETEYAQKISEELRKDADKKSQKKVLTLDEKLFQAGAYSEADKKEFRRLRLLIPVFLIPGLTFPLIATGGAVFGVLGFFLGVLASLQVPFSILDRRIKSRAEEIMYYLPIVIEQISIGVSSSLDVGPCLQRIVALADERNTHNPVSELIRYALFYIKSGVSFEDAMVETGKASGHTELKHAFMFLAQVAKHGGEITRQLQELADAVSKQREAYIDERIKKLELAATGPLFLVFAGFVIMLMSGIAAQIATAF